MGRCFVRWLVLKGLVALEFVVVCRFALNVRMVDLWSWCFGVGYKRFGEGVLVNLHVGVIDGG